MEELSGLLLDPFSDFEARRNAKNSGAFPFSLWIVKRIEDGYEDIARRRGLFGVYSAFRSTTFFEQQRISVGRAIGKLYPVPEGMTTVDYYSVGRTLVGSDERVRYVREMDIQYLIAVVTLSPAVWAAAMPRAIYENDPNMAVEILKARDRGLKRMRSDRDRLALLIVQHWLPLGLWLLPPKEAVQLLSAATGRKGLAPETFKMALRRMGLRRQKGIAHSLRNRSDGTTTIRLSQVMQDAIKERFQKLMRKKGRKKL